MCQPSWQRAEDTNPKKFKGVKRYQNVDVNNMAGLVLAI